jgi:hypothetical protein
MSGKMKRSEAIQLIREIMAANHPLTDHEGCPYVSEEILRTLEKSGMLPPFTYLKNLGTLDTAWENEDEV